MPLQTGTATQEPVASLVALTEEARRALGNRSGVPVASLPFRVGRERRTPSARSVPQEERRGATPQLNDVYLLDSMRKHLFVSGAHFAIDREADSFVLMDRGSACGTVVAGTRVGGRRTGGRTELRSGDEIVVGTRTSPYVYRFEVASE